MPLTRIKSLGITDGTITGDDINSTFNLTGKTVTLPSGTGGKVLQVLQGTYTTQMSTTSGTYQDMNLSVSITPASASNKILVMASISTALGGGGADSGGAIIILRGTTQITGSSAYDFYTYESGGAGELACLYAISYLDSPSTTSAITYKTQFAAFYGGTFYVHRGKPSSIIVMEIAA